MTQRRYTILIVDDNPINTALARSIVLNIPPEAYIETAKDGKETIARFFEIQPDLVPINVQMPLMSGYDAIRAKEQGMPTPIIALTAGRR